MTQNLKIEVVTGDLSIEGVVVTNLVTKEEMAASLVGKADLGEDGKILPEQIPSNLTGVTEAVMKVKNDLNDQISDTAEAVKVHAESYTDDSILNKADLGEDGKVLTSQLPELSSYTGYQEGLDKVKNDVLTEVKKRTDQLDLTKATLGEDGKVLREQLPNYELIPNLPEKIEALEQQDINLAKAITEQNSNTKLSLETLSQAMAENNALLLNRQSHLMKIYPTKELGVDKVVGAQNGEYFNVRSTNVESFIEEYMNENGIARFTGRSYPSQESVTNIIKSITDAATGENVVIRNSDKLKYESVSIRDFGAKGNDDQTVYDVPSYMTGRDKAFMINKQTADGIAINRALDWLKSRGGGALYIPPCEPGKSYRIWGYLKHIDFPCVIYGAGAASLIKNCDTSPTNTNGYGIFVVQPKNAEEVSFMNLRLDGNAEIRAKPTSELQLYPLIVYGMPRFRMYGVTSENSPIDCFTVTFDTGFDAEGMSCFATIVNCLFNNSYRNTVTTSKGHNIKFVNCLIQRGGFIHGGTNPRYCVDIEPNSPATVVNTKWLNCTFSHGRNVLVGGVWSDSMFSNCTFDASYIHPDNTAVGREHFPWVFQFTAGQWDIDNCKFLGRKDYMRNQCHHYNAYGTTYNFTDDVYLRIKNSNFIHCGVISSGRSISLENCLAQLSMCPFLFQGGTASPTHDVYIRDLKLVNVFDGTNAGSGTTSSFAIASSIKGVVDIDGLTCEVDDRSLTKIPASLFTDSSYFGIWIPDAIAANGRRCKVSRVYSEGYYNRIGAYTGYAKNTSKRRDWGRPNLPPADTDLVTSTVTASLTDGTVASNAVTNKAVTGTATQNNPISSRTLGGRAAITWKECTMWGDYA